MNSVKAVLILGGRDEPTDGVADYCDQLREAGAARGLSFECRQVAWAEKGWPRALAELREAASQWSNRWVFLQYTTLAWSRRGFPLLAARVLEILLRGGARTGVVFHDFAPLAGKGIVGSAREYVQLHVLRQLYAKSDLAVFTVPMKKVSWLPLHRGKAIFIPVGANCPEITSCTAPKSDSVLTVAVYGVTGGAHISHEVADIAHAVNQAGQARRLIRLIVFGRGSREAEPALRPALAGTNIEVEVLGLLSPEQVTAAFARSDVLLFVRGHISSRRGSAIAAIACGLPIVCYSGRDTDWPVTEAGILAVPLGDREGLAAALENVLSDPQLRKKMAERSRKAQERYFSWRAITGEFARALKGPVDAEGQQSSIQDVALAPKI